MYRIDFVTEPRLLLSPSPLSGSPYQAYVYAYPHKSAYRPFTPPIPLRPLWAAEDRQQLFLYVHVPFCTMRCGFCNLFTQAQPQGALPQLYLDALQRQADATHAVLGEARFSRLAVGGGTPTYFSVAELEQLFGLVRSWGVDPHQVPSAVEVSPDTISPEKIALLREVGIERVSIGVQSFFEQETANSGRPQTRAEVDDALARLTQADFPILNLDLIYGLPHQTVESWLSSIEAALRYEPEELFLYPLYVRAGTGLGRSWKSWDDVRLACYREARDRLLAAGYQQFSMRMFHKPRRANPTSLNYCCQQDGMVGLGCGARSYTRGLHYSLDYAVTPKSVKQIIADYLAHEPEDFRYAENGFVLDESEQRRRFVLQSLLNRDGLNGSAYQSRFGSTVLEDFPVLPSYVDCGLLRQEPDRWTPTDLGLERSDALGPAFFSATVQHLMATYELR